MTSNGLISLLGAPTGVAKWDDGNGTDSIGHRRDLAGKRVLVAFQLQTGGGYWLPITLGRKIKVNESGPKPTIAFLGRSWNWRLILHMRSKFWILPQWVGAEDVQVGALGEQEVIPSREELALEARVGAGIAEFEVTGSLRSLWYDAQKKGRVSGRSLSTARGPVPSRVGRDFWKGLSSWKQERRSGLVWSQSDL